MTIEKLTEFAKDTNAKNLDGLNQNLGFPSKLQPARQWFNWLFNSLTAKINEIIDKKLDSNANASSATKLKDSVDIEISGAVSGKSKFDGAQSINIETVSNHAIGVNQNWEDVKSIRAFDTTYTNNTDKPIQIFICANFDDGYVVINDIRCTLKDAAAWGFLNLIIPVGSTYKIEGNSPHEILTWIELR